jgi:hypothetical protein
LHQVGVHAARQHLADFAAVLVALVGLDHHRLGKPQITQALLGALAVGPRLIFKDFRCFSKRWSPKVPKQSISTPQKEPSHSGHANPQTGGTLSK